MKKQNRVSIRNIFASTIGRKLFAGFLLLSLVPLLVVSLIGAKIIYDKIIFQQEQAVDATLHLKKQQVEFFFGTIVRDLETQSHLQANLSFIQYLHKISELPGQPAKENSENKEMPPSLASDTGLDMQIFASSHSYEDILFLDKDGRILYSAFNGKLVGTNFSGIGNDKAILAKAFHKVLESDTDVFTDFFRQVSSQSGYSAIMLRKMVDFDGRTAGILALQISATSLNAILRQDVDLGSGGDLYLVGTDGLLRSDSLINNRQTVMTRGVQNELVRKWIAGRELQSSVEQRISRGQTIGDAMALLKGSYRGDKEMDLLVDLQVPELAGLDWALVIRKNVGDSLQVLWTLATIITVTFLLTALVIIRLSLRLVNNIVAPVNALTAWANRIAIGDFSYSDIRVTNDEIGELKMCFDQVVQSFRDVTDVCKSIAMGDFSIVIPVRSEDDALGRAVQQMAENLEAVVKQADAVALGDYSATILPRSEKDKLSKALLNMTTILKEITEENHEQDWLKTGYGMLNDLLRGEKELAPLCRELISFLAKYLKSAVGALYLLEKVNGREVLRQVSSYSLKKRKNLANEFALGEGIVGQVAREGETIVISNVPADYLVLQSGTGEASPLWIVAVPVFYNNRLKGVLELGAFQEFNDLKLEFLENCVQNIGIALNTTESRGELARLLEESRQHEKQLGIQQEELRQTVEELETQTKALKKSEEHLNVQQEELRVTNEELEEQTKVLEEQKNAIVKKNRELEEAHREIEEKAESLARSSQYKSEFLANMSHELRTPLNSILLLSQLMATNSESSLSPKELEYVQAIHSSGADLLALITDILDLSKVEAGRLDISAADISFAEIAASLQQTFSKVAAEKNIGFSTEIAPGLPESIVTDSQRLLQILKNLVSNGIKFTHDGQVTVKCLRPAADTVFRESALEPATAVAFRVTDTGVGISRDKQEVIFEAFQQADGTISRKYGGTGLGLSLSKKLAALLGGEIQVTSVVGQGSVFTLYLPEAMGDVSSGGRRAAQAVTPAPAPVVPPSLPRKKKGGSPLVAHPPLSTPESAQSAYLEDDRHSLEKDDRVLLIIEDDNDFARILLDLARAKGFKCIIAGDGEAGLHYADYYKPCAIILDVGLPGMDGWHVMDRLKEFPDTRHIPVHFISAYDQSIDALRRGAIGYITKPVSVQELSETLARIEKYVSKLIKMVLVVENDTIQRKSIVDLIANKQLDISSVDSGEAAYDVLQNKSFDLMILDLNLGDMSGFELLDKISDNSDVANMPIIIYTGRDLTREEETLLQKYADSIIIKGIRSPERLLAEATLFLHQVEKDLPAEKQKMIRMVSDRETSLEGRKVLIVDDDMRNVFALSNLLQAHGLTVSVAANGIECLEFLEKEPDMDLILMDIMMPEMDGYEAMQRIRAQPRFRELPILALTAKAMRGDRDKCIEAGANDYLAKPVDMPKLLSLLRVWLYR